MGSPATSSPPASPCSSTRASSSAADYQERPERYEYFLTEKGLDLWPVLVALIGWGDRHEAGADGPPAVIVHKDCGGRVNDRRICERCGDELAVREARMLEGDEASEYLAGESAAFA